eukprot:gene13988-biopygen15630
MWCGTLALERDFAIRAGRTPRRRSPQGRGRGPSGTRRGRGPGEALLLARRLTGMWMDLPLFGPLLFCGPPLLLDGSCKQQAGALGNSTKRRVAGRCLGGAWITPDPRPTQRATCTPLPIWGVAWALARRRWATTWRPGTSVATWRRPCLAAGWVVGRAGPRPSATRNLWSGAVPPDPPWSTASPGGAQSPALTHLWQGREHLESTGGGGAASRKSGCPYRVLLFL